LGASVLDELLVQLEDNDALQKPDVKGMFQCFSIPNFVPSPAGVVKFEDNLKPSELSREKTPELKGGGHVAVGVPKQRISFFGNKNIAKKSRKRKLQPDLLGIDPRQSVLRPRVLKEMKKQVEDSQREAAIQNFSRRLVQGSILL